VTSNVVNGVHKILAYYVIRNIAVYIF